MTCVSNILDNIKSKKDLINDLYLNKQSKINKEILNKFRNLNTIKDFIIFDFYLSNFMSKDERKDFYRRNKDENEQRTIEFIINEKLHLFLKEHYVDDLENNENYIQILNQNNINTSKEIISFINEFSDIFYIKSQINDNKYSYLKSNEKTLDTQIFLFRNYYFLEKNDNDFYYKKGITTFFENSLTNLNNKRFV